MLYDSHAHLNNNDFEDEARRASFLADTQAAVDSGLLSYVNNIGFDLASSKLAVDQAAAYPWCYAAVGIHPHDTDGCDDMQLALIRALAKKPKVVAIGEIGLDFYRNLSNPDNQRHWFRQQIRLANELRMPIVIHDRDAHEEVMTILREEGAFSAERRRWWPRRSANVSGRYDPALSDTPDARVLLHCYSGSLEQAEQYVRMGATISIAGPVTYKNNRKTQAVAAGLPIEYLLVETDAPYLTPEPHRGHENRPPHVEHTARKVAELKGMTFEETARITCENAKRFFGI